MRKPVKVDSSRYPRVTSFSEGTGMVTLTESDVLQGVRDSYSQVPPVLQAMVEEMIKYHDRMMKQMLLDTFTLTIPESQSGDDYSHEGLKVKFLTHYHTGVASYGSVLTTGI
jgi:hypothetical protein